MVVSVSVNNLDTRDCISRLSDREGQDTRDHTLWVRTRYIAVPSHGLNRLYVRCNLSKISTSLRRHRSIGGWRPTSAEAPWRAHHVEARQFEWRMVRL